jgi:DNA-binding transcriptional LysR family regulator
LTAADAGHLVCAAALTKQMVSMTEIDHAHLARLDLNLLLALDALLSEQSVTRAAARLGLGQSAMSHSLARLRSLFGDELLTRTPEGMRPTPRAMALRERVRAAVAGVQSVFAPRDTFDAASAQRIFRIGLPDSMEVLLFPALLDVLCTEAPGLRLRLHTVGDPAQILADLDADRLDVAVGVGALPEGRTHHKQRMLTATNYLCIFNAALLAVEVPLSLDAYLRFPHVLTSLRQGQAGVVDTALAAMGLSRTVSLVTPRFLAVPFMVRGAPVIATMHAELARLFASALALSLSPPPIDLPELRYSLLWHASYDDDPGHRWLRQAIFRLAGAAG